MIEAPYQSKEKSLDTSLRWIAPNFALWSNDFCSYPKSKIRVPSKILRREQLSTSGLCTMGSIVIPPNTPLDQEKLIEFWKTLNQISIEQKRPIDHDLFIRTATEKGTTSYIMSKEKNNQENWSDPAALIMLNQGSISKTKFFGKSATSDTTLDQFICNNQDRWLIIHSDDKSHQEKAIHARLLVGEYDSIILELGNGVMHARELENLTVQVEKSDLEIASCHGYRCLVATRETQADPNTIRDLIKKAQSGLINQIPFLIEKMRAIVGNNSFSLELRLYRQTNPYSLQVMDYDIAK